MPLSWSEERPPNEECSYDHVVAETPLGQIRIEWKGWKDPWSQGHTAIMPWGEIVHGADLNVAKSRVQWVWDNKVRALAVVVATGDRRFGAYAAVIEAAKEVEEYLCELEGTPVNYRLGKRLSALGKAVRALAESETE